MIGSSDLFACSVVHRRRQATKNDGLSHVCFSYEFAKTTGHKKRWPVTGRFFIRIRVVQRRRQATKNDGLSHVCFSYEFAWCSEDDRPQKTMACPTSVFHTNSRGAAKTTGHKKRWPVPRLFFIRIREDDRPQKTMACPTTGF